MVGLFCCTALHALVLCRFSLCVVIGEVTHRLPTERKVEEIGIKGLSDKFLSHFITFHHQVLDRKCGNERSNTLLQIVQEHHPSELRLLATASRPGGRRLEGTRRLVESLLKASTYSRLFKIIQDYSREGYGMVWSCRKPLGFLSLLPHTQTKFLAMGLINFIVASVALNLLFFSTLRAV